MRAEPRANHYEISMLANIRRLEWPCQRAWVGEYRVFICPRHPRAMLHPFRESLTMILVPIDPLGVCH